MRLTVSAHQRSTRLRDVCRNTRFEMVAASIMALYS